MLVAIEVPGGDCQTWPLRPLPAVCSPALTTVNSAAEPSSARRLISLFVESMDSWYMYMGFNICLLILPVEKVSFRPEKKQEVYIIPDRRRGSRT